MDMWLIAMVVVVVLYVTLAVMDKHAKGRKVDKLIDLVTRVLLIILASRR